MPNFQSCTELPLVSVIIPAYNAEVFIERTLQSVLQQTYQNLEIIVVDDGSSDRTSKIVESLALTDSRLTLIQQTNAGVAVARNLAIQMSHGEFIAPIDADDIWHPTNIEKQVQCILRSNPSVGVIYTWSVDIDENDRPTGEFRASNIEGNVYLTLLCHNFLGNSSASLIRRTCLERVGNYNSKLKENQAQGCEDWDLYLRLAEYYQYRVVTEFLVGYRKLTNSMSCSSRTMAKSHSLMLQAVKRKHPKIPEFLYQVSSSSFYIYLARQSSQNNDPQNALYWLHQAIQVDRITPFLRLGLYLLFVKNFLKRVTASSIKPAKAKSDRSPLVQQKDNSLTIENFRGKATQVWLKILVGQMIYYGTLIFSRYFENQELLTNSQQQSLRH